MREVKGKQISTYKLDFQSLIQDNESLQSLWLVVRVEVEVEVVEEIADWRSGQDDGDGAQLQHEESGRAWLSDWRGEAIRYCWLGRVLRTTISRARRGI